MAYGDIDQPNFGFTEEELAKSFPDAEYGSEKWNRFYEVKGQVAPSYLQMTQTSPEGFPGGFMGWIDYQTALGNIGNESQGLGGIAGFLRQNGWVVPLAAGAAFGGLAAAGAGAGAGAGGAGAALTPEAYMTSAGLTPGVFEGAAFTLPQGLGAATGVGAELAGPTYQELGYTGLEAGQMGPTYGELGYTGLNNAEAIAAADAASAATKGMTLSEALSAANKARQGLGLASTLAKLAGGTGSQVTGTTGQQLASLLRPTNTFNPINLQQIQPKNPFFGSNQGTLGGEDIYDVSGMANALRNR